MINDTRNTNDRDLSRIDQSREEDRNYWTDKWNITEEELSQAIDAAESIMVEDVERWLKENDKIT